MRSKEFLKTKIIFFCLLLLTPHSLLLTFLQAQEPILGAQAKITEGQKISLGEPFEVQYTLTLSREAKLELSNWKAGTTQWGNFTLWDFEIKTEPKENLQSINLKIKFVPFVLGDAEIPDLQIPYRKNPADNTFGAIATPALPVSVSDPTAKTPTEGPRDIKAPRKPLYFWEHPLFILSALIFVILGAIGLFFLYKSRHKTQRFVEQQELLKLSPEEGFHKSLQALMQAGLLEERKYRPFYFGLSEIFRNYLDRRFKLDTETLTTRELLK
ncbi:MAG: hypothetical protein Q7K28_03820, partial [Candidatus Wildermuthbacteria bacterium]|nr:hypothetical protein [Candidatus Wildermuthbacteria bacterium]